MVLQVNRPVTFTVDASQAGEGTLELVVTTAKASVRAEVAARSRGLYDVTFTPHEPIAHFVNITFNEEEVIGMFLPLIIVTSFLSFIFYSRLYSACTNLCCSSSILL